MVIGMDGNKTGELIAARLSDLGMTQTQLAEVIGVSYQQVSNWATGFRRPNMASLIKLAAALKCKADDLIR